MPDLTPKTGFYSPYFNDSTVIQLWDETFFRPINVIYTGERVNFKVRVTLSLRDDKYGCLMTQ